MAEHSCSGLWRVGGAEADRLVCCEVLLSRGGLVGAVREERSLQTFVPPEVGQQLPGAVGEMDQRAAHRLALHLGVDIAVE